jgi:hypothetical protein
MKWMGDLCRFGSQGPLKRYFCLGVAGLEQAPAKRLQIISTTDLTMPFSQSFDSSKTCLRRQPRENPNLEAEASKLVVFTPRGPVDPDAFSLGGHIRIEVLR